jgi:hypothetical protein
VWALMTSSYLFKYSLFSEDRDLSLLRRFKGTCDRLWMQFNNWVSSSSPTSSIWFAFSKFHGEEVARNQEVPPWIRKRTFSWKSPLSAMISPSKFAFFSSLTKSGKDVNGNPLLVGLTFRGARIQLDYSQWITPWETSCCALQLSYCWNCFLQE